MMMVLAGSGPGLLDEMAMELMRNHETIGIGTTVSYPEVKSLLNHWITTSLFSVQPGHKDNKLQWLENGEFDKYFCTTESNEKRIREWCRNVHRPKFYRNSLTTPRLGHPDGTVKFDYIKVLTLGWQSGMGAAGSLAKHLGATSCVLVGSDYIGNKRADGSKNLSDMKFNCLKTQNVLAAKNFGIPVYKTNSASPIGLKLYEN